ncbi:MAG: transposase [Sphingomonadaceae bacterium]|nr:helix-turn-helix domain-containing protein [Sphingomonadaceae bacterium]
MVAIPQKQEKLARIIELIAGGKGVTESCREVGVSEKTYYRWKRELEEQL